MVRTLGVVVLCALSSAAAGCSSGETFPETVPVTGTVKYQGKPVEGAEVVFATSEEGGRSASGQTDNQGRFSLKTYFTPGHQPAGAVPGTYTITVTKLEGGSQPDNPPDMRAMMQSGKVQGLPQNTLPKQYAEAGSSPLKETVKEGETNDFALELTD